MPKMTQKQFLEFIRRPTETTHQLRRSTRFYLDKLPYYAENAWFTSWNWSAFFFGFIWMFYRKMYFFGLITFFITNILLGLSLISTKLFYEGFISPAILLQEFDRIPLMLVWMILIGVFSNALYFNFATRILSMGKSKRSGTNIWAAILVLLVTQVLDATQLKICQHYNVNMMPWLS